MILYISVLSVVISQFAFLILLIWLFSLILLVPLTHDLSILCIFSKKHLLVLLLFAIVCFVSLSFYLNPSFYDLFPSITLGFFISFFPSWFRCKVRLFIWFFSCFLRENCIAMNLPISTAFTESHRFWVVVFSFSFVSMHILIFFLISSKIWLLRNVLFIFHQFSSIQ